MRNKKGRKVVARWWLRGRGPQEGQAMCVLSLSRGKTTRETTNEGVRAEGVWAGKEKERWAGLGLKGKERKNWARGEREAQGREEGFSFLFLFKTV
jgi:hypothetical protein